MVLRGEASCGMKEHIDHLVESYSRRFKRDKAVSALQVGSSLSEEDFFDNSDLDFLVVYDKKIRKNFVLEYTKKIEINVMRRSKGQFLRLLEEGNPVDLIALRFGRVLFDDGFLEGLRGDYKQTQRTVERWMHTASFSLSSAASNYSLPACVCCYFKDLHHSARDFSRAMILKKKNELVEGNTIIMEHLTSLYPELVEDYRFILSGRRNYQNFEPRYLKTKKIEENEMGRYLLAGQNFAKKAYEVVLGLVLPKVNDLISELERRTEIDHYHGFWLSPEKKEIAVSLILKGEKVEHFAYHLAERRWKC